MTGKEVVEYEEGHEIESDKKSMTKKVVKKIKMEEKKLY